MQELYNVARDRVAFIHRVTRNRYSSMEHHWNWLQPAGNAKMTTEVLGSERDISKM